MSFAGDINKFNLRLNNATEETIQAVELELFSSIILDSPVDTGRFRVTGRYHLMRLKAALSRI